MITESELNELKEFATEARRCILKMIHNAKSGHTGGSLSGVDILTVLYNKCMFVPKEWKDSPDFEKRDRFILSKGHASPLLYSMLALKGFFPKDELMTFRLLGSRLQGHPCCRALPGIEVSTGSLGQGLSIGCGMAIGLKLNKSDSRVYVLTGDGELQEGSVWEAFMQGAHRNLNNLTVIIDRNRLQIDGCTEDVMSLDPLNEKVKAFGWNVIEIDGHDYQQIYDAIESSKKSDKPTAIIANTVKGKGVSFIENQAGWHGKAPNDEQLEKALAELV
ncbi:transketolase [bacterium]|nr:transketolase [bacterium]